MEALILILAINVALSATEIVDVKNASDVSKVESRKIKHIISKIYTAPHDESKTSMDKESYRRLIDMIRNKSSSEAIDSIESNEKINFEDGENHKIIIKTLRNEPIVSTFAKTRHEENNVDNSMKNKSKISEYNEEVQPRMGNILSKETELNGDALSEIIKRLKVANLGDKNRIHKGKLVIYYDDDDDEDSTENSKENDFKESEEILDIDEEIRLLYSQLNVPMELFWEVQRRNFGSAEARIKTLVKALIRYLAFTGDLNWDVIRHLEILLAKYRSDIDIIKIILSLGKKLGSIGLDTSTESLSTATNLIETIIENATSNVDKILNDESSTVLNIPNNIIKNNDDTKVSPEEIVSTMKSILLNAGDSDSPLNPTSTALKDIIYGNLDNTNVPIGQNIEYLPTEVINVFGEPEDEDSITEEIISKIISDPSKNVFDILNNEPDKVIESSLVDLVTTPKNILNDYKMNKNAINVLFDDADNKNVAKTKNNKTGDILKHIVGQIKDKNYDSKRIPYHIKMCDHEDCRLDVVDDKVKLQFNVLKSVLTSALQDFMPQIQEILSNLPVLSNIPIHEYIKHSKGKPFLIYVLFPNSLSGDSKTENDGINWLMHEQNGLRSRIPILKLINLIMKGLSGSDINIIEIIKAITSLKPNIDTNNSNVIVDVINKILPSILRNLNTEQLPEILDILGKVIHDSAPIDKNDKIHISDNVSIPDSIEVNNDLPEINNDDIIKITDDPNILDVNEVPNTSKIDILTLIDSLIIPNMPHKNIDQPQTIHDLIKVINPKIVDTPNISKDDVLKDHTFDVIKDLINHNHGANDKLPVNIDDHPKIIDILNEGQQEDIPEPIKKIINPSHTNREIGLPEIVNDDTIKNLDIDEIKDTHAIQNGKLSLIDIIQKIKRNNNNDGDIIQQTRYLIRRLYQKIKLLSLSGLQPKIIAAFVADDYKESISKITENGTKSCLKNIQKAIEIAKHKEMIIFDRIEPFLHKQN